MVEENQVGQNQDNFFKYDTGTLTEIYTSPIEGLVSFGLGLGGFVNALINGGEHKILRARVKPLPGLEPTKEDYEGKRFNPYLIFGGWLGSETEYKWGSVTLREKKEEELPIYPGYPGYPGVPTYPEYPGYPGYPGPQPKRRTYPGVRTRPFPNIN